MLNRLDTLTERVCLFFIVLGIGYLAMFFVLGLPQSVAYMTILIGIFGVAIGLVRVKRPGLASMLLTASISSALLLYSVLLGLSTGAHLIFFPIAALPIILYYHNQAKWTLIGCGIPILHRYGLELITYYDPPILHSFRENLSAGGQLFVYQIAILTSFLFTIYFVYFYFSAVRSFQLKLEETAKNERDAKLSLQTTNTQLHQTNQSLSNALQELQHHATIGAVTRGIMHEVMGPITAIKSSCEVIVSQPEVPPKTKTIVSRIDGYLDHLTELIQSMLINQGKIKHSESPLDINKSILQAVRLIQNDATRNQIKLTTQFGEIPVIKGSVAYFSQAILNLLLNALRYSPPNSQITIKTWQDNQDIWITIQDQGPGIAPEIKNRLFQQGATTAGADTGNNHVGLGLFFVKQVAESHGGEVLVVETSDRGAVFGVRLPIESPVTAHNGL